jgi:hypothetical protein
MRLRRMQAHWKVLVHTMTKHAFPWEVDRHAGFHTGMSDRELIAWLRHNAIKEGAPNRFIDRLNDLECSPSEDDIEEYVREAKKEEREDCCAKVEYAGERIGLTNEQIKQIVDYVREE